MDTMKLDDVVVAHAEERNAPNKAVEIYIQPMSMSILNVLYNPPTAMYMHTGNTINVQLNRCRI